MPDERRIPYARQLIDEDDIAAVAAVLRSDRLTTGPVVEEFERQIARRSDQRFGVAVNSGTAALHAAYAALGLGPGDELITSPLTFVATASAALHLGARVRFADVDTRTGCLSASFAADGVTSATRILAAVDYAGHPVEYQDMRHLASERGLAFVVDAAHSLGARWMRCPAGFTADATIYSFHPVKAITTAEGGAVVTNSERLAERMREFRSHGVVRRPERFVDGHGRGAWYYEAQHLGFNYRLPDVLCALGVSQLRKLNAFIARRRWIAGQYTASLSALAALELPWVDPRAEPAWHLYVIRVRDASRREALFAALQRRGLMVQVHYHPVHLQPVFQALGYRAGSCPNAEDFAERAISLPIFPAMSDDDVRYAIDAVMESVREVL